MGWKRIDADEIERRLLDLAFTTDVKVTALALAYYAPCSIEDASKVLDTLATRERVHMEVEDDGTVVYRIPGRQRLTSEQQQPAPRSMRPPADHHISPLIAALLSVCVPGAGHLYAGRIASAVAWFFVVSVGYLLILPGLLLHLFSIVSAATTANRLNTRTTLVLADHCSTA